MASVAIRVAGNVESCGQGRCGRRPVKRRSPVAPENGRQRTFAGMASMPRSGKAALLRLERLEAGPEVPDDGRHRGMAAVGRPAQVDEGDIGRSLSAGRIAASAVEAHARGSFREISQPRLALGTALPRGFGVDQRTFQSRHSLVIDRSRVQARPATEPHALASSAPLTAGRA